jgi:hypothetical protein
MIDRVVTSETKATFDLEENGLDVPRVPFFDGFSDPRKGKLLKIFSSINSLIYFERDNSKTVAMNKLCCSTCIR